MNLEKLQNYIQNYLNEVITPSLNKKMVGNDEPIILTVNALRRGEYDPQYLYIFIDIDPDPGIDESILNKLAKNIKDFMKIFSTTSKVVVYWNSRPLF